MNAAVANNWRSVLCGCSVGSLFGSRCPTQQAAGEGGEMWCSRGHVHEVIQHKTAVSCDASAVECRSRAQFQRGPLPQVGGPVDIFTLETFGGKLFVQQQFHRSFLQHIQGTVVLNTPFLLSPRRHSSASRSRGFVQAPRCYDAAAEVAAAAAAACYCPNHPSSWGAQQQADN